MPYQYGMQNSPSGGNGLGGLPKKQTTPKEVNFTRVLGSNNLVSGVIVPPANAKYMRVAAIGAGGYVIATLGGSGGGGCAASKIVPASSISYSITASDTANTIGGTTASFPGYQLFGQKSPGGLGGVGRGGDYNYSGGNSDGSRGGGAAGPMGNGQTPTTGAQPPVLSVGWGVGGGSGSIGQLTHGGGGAGASSATSTSTQYGASVWGTPPSTSFGGALGGGSGDDGSNNRVGGVGGIVVEWFYD